MEIRTSGLLHQKNEYKMNVGRIVDHFHMSKHTKTYPLSLLLLFSKIQIIQIENQHSLAFAYTPYLF